MTESKLQNTFKPAEFEAADRLERLYMHRLDPTHCPLDEREQKHFFRLRYAMIISIAGKKTSTQITWELQRDLGIKLTSARTLLAQLPVVYPDILDNARILEKEDAVAKLHQVISRCEKRDTTYDDEVIGKTTRIIADIRQWGKEDLGIKKGDIQLPQPMWTDDPSVLELDPGTDAPEEAEFEELDNDNAAGAMDEEAEDE